MPELPEVETTLRGIAPHIVGEHISSTVVRNPALRWPVSSQIEDLKAFQVRRAVRRGKYIILEGSDGAIIIHLGMSGNLRVLNADAALKAHDHLDMVLGNGSVVRFNDPRRFGCVLWAEDWQKHDLIRSMGIEPLDEEFTAAYLYQQARNKKVAIKQFIMNGKIVVGVGNIYANEALFLAGIHPARAAGKVSLKRMEVLVSKIKAVLSVAIEQGGTTLRDFVGSDGKPGYFKQSLYVYGRAGLACSRCQSSLREIRQAQRSTVFCKDCQK